MPRTLSIAVVLITALTACVPGRVRQPPTAQQRNVDTVLASRVTIYPEYVVSVARPDRRGVESDAVIQTVWVENTGPDEVQLASLTFDFRAKGQTVQRVVYPSEALARRTEALVRLMANLPDSQIQLIFQQPRFWAPERISPTPVLPAGYSTGIFMEHVNLNAAEPLDECLISVALRRGEVETTVSRSVRIAAFTPSQQYIFPLKGAWFALNNYDSLTHRPVPFEEFAMDIVTANSNLEIVPSQAAANADYPMYGKPVYAIGDGVVVDSADGVPENPPGLESGLSPEQMAAVEKTHGFIASLAGNFVTIDHGQGDFSFYAHLVPGLAVKKGDKVKQGQLLGNLGNSCNSTGPHLHFQLMNGPDILSARGLPCYFTNLKDIDGEPLPLIYREGSLVYAE